jgi:hypothetical protein
MLLLACGPGPRRRAAEPLTGPAVLELGHLEEPWMVLRPGLARCAIARWRADQPEPVWAWLDEQGRQVRYERSTGGSFEQLYEGGCPVETRLNGEPVADGGPAAPT